MIPERAAAIPTPDGAVLEAALSVPASASRGVVICHPHPLYGGDMHNPVVVRAAEVCAALDMATLRFNFRGVGGSTGAHGDGLAEQEDVRAALAHLAGGLGPRAPLALVGYSFGASMAAAVAAGPGRLAGLALVAPPLASPGFPRVGRLTAVDGPVLVVAGSKDPYCPPADLERLRAELPGAEVETIEGADHFFFGKLYPLGEAITRWARRIG